MDILYVYFFFKVILCRGVFYSFGKIYDGGKRDEWQQK